MKQKAAERKLAGRRVWFDQWMARGSSEQGVNKRKHSGGYKRPGSTKQKP